VVKPAVMARMAGIKAGKQPTSNHKKE